MGLVAIDACGISFTGEVVGIKIGACFPFDFASVALFALVNELPVEILDTEKLKTVARSNSVTAKAHLSLGQKMTVMTSPVLPFLSVCENAAGKCRDR